MKTKIITAALTISLVITSLCVKSNSLTRLTKKVEPQKTMMDYFKFPQIVIHVSESQKVEVLFTTNQFGKVDFVLAKTNNQNLKTEIEKQFLKLNITKIKSDVVHSVVLNIKTI